MLRVYGRLAKSRNVKDFMWETWTKNSNRNIILSPISSTYIPENIRNHMSFALAGSLLFLSQQSLPPPAMDDDVPIAVSVLAKAL